MKIGCHVSIAGGVENAPANAAELGCEVFQIFSRSPRGGPAPKITKQTSILFWQEMKKYGYDTFVIHTPYYINFGSSNKKIYYGSIDVIREELERGNLLGAKYVITHMGSFKDLGWDNGFEQLVTGLEKVLTGYSGSTELLLEISAGAGEVIGDTFEEIARIINHKGLKNFPIGVCFDTCHVFASGYDLRTPVAVKATFGKFDKIIGLDRLKAFHANDSKFGIGEHKDRHEHIGKGNIGRAGFAAMLNHPKLKKLNMYLETEHDFVKDDINMLKKIRK